MINLEKKQKVLIDFHQHGKSQRTIAKELGMSRNTVKKYIDQDLLARKKETRELPISTNSVMPPAYKKRISPKKALTKSAMRRIREMLKQNKQKRIRNMHKQQLKIVDIHEKLLDEGFKISYTTVHNFINIEEKRHREVFIRQKPTAG
nr:helix-turn-helix domain-containing protein [Bacillus wiedmannii]